MITALRLEHLVLVDRLDVSFEAGLTVITGETGSGKSLLLDGLSLAFGAKATGRDWLKPGETKARVEVSIDLPRLPNREAVLAQLAELGVELDAEDTDELLLTREFTATGSRCRINGTPVPRDRVAQLRPLILGLHDQHELDLLFQRAYPRVCVDALGGEALAPLRAGVRDACQRWQRLSEQVARLTQARQDRAQREDFLRFQLQELTAAALTTADEDERLRTALDRLRHGESLRQAAGKSLQVLSADGGVVESLRQVDRWLSSAARLDAGLAPLADRVQGWMADAQDLASELSDYAERVDIDPARLDALTDRLDRLERLKRKYGPTLAEVLDTAQRVAQELNESETVDETLSLLTEEVAEAEAELQTACAALTVARQSVAEQLTAAMAERLPPLGLAAARFEVSMEPQAPGPEGADAVGFGFSANPGQPLRPLSAVASGGELSRVLLALKSLTAEADRVGSLVFDEIDTGISGQTAAAVAEQLLHLSRRVQLLVITHQPMVAAVGDHHLHVEKHLDPAGGAVHVAAEMLLKKEKRLAILSRLASGIDTDDEAVEPFIGRLLHRADILKAAAAGLSPTR